MRDDPKFVEWMGYQRRIAAEIKGRLACTTTEAYRAYNARIDVLSLEARPLWNLLSTRYDYQALNAAARELYEVPREI